MIPAATAHYQLSTSPAGHCLHHTKCFSPDDAWIVFDNRNTDPGIGSSNRISVISSRTGGEYTIYETENHTEYGPGAGAVSFSPASNMIIFIHGLRNCNEALPYAFNRRTAAMIKIDQSQPRSTPELIFPDARNIVPPYTTGALRGGTHAHLWDNNGNWISFTYDDYVMDRLSAGAGHNLFKRTVGIMIPHFKVALNESPQDYTRLKSDTDFENHSGSMFSFIIASTTHDPQKGTDQIDTAFDETWIGNNGYLKADGSRQQKAIAFQGNTLNEQGYPQTEIFVADLPNVFKRGDFDGTEGTEVSPPIPPKGIKQRRITFTKDGIKAPRHWLRSTPDGQRILYLNADDKGVTQLYAVNTNAEGQPVQISFHEHPIEGPFNISPDGSYAAYISNNKVTLTSIDNGRSIHLEDPEINLSKAAGAVIWSNSGKKLAYNRFVRQDQGEYLQIFIVELQHK